MKKRILSILLCLCMALSLLPTATLAADYTTPGGLTITGGTEGTDYSYAGGCLTITGTGTYTISGTSTTDTIEVASNDTVAITLDRVNIDVRTLNAYAPMSITNTSTVDLTLVGDNVLTSGDGWAGLDVAQGAMLNITSQSTGTLTASGGSGGAGIGGGNYAENYGIINIAGGNVNAVAGSGAEAIGYGAGLGNGSVSGPYGPVLHKPTVVTLNGVTDPVNVSTVTLTVGSLPYEYPYSCSTLAGKLYLWLPDGAIVTGATADDTQYCGSVTSGENGTLDVPVASVTASGDTPTTTNYADFSSALTAAQANSGSTLKLLDNVTSSNRIDIGSTMTLDLNGHTLDMGDTLYVNTGSGDLTVNDSSADKSGVLTSSATPLRINGNVTVNSGTIQTTGAGNFAFWCENYPCENNANVVINGGTFIGTRCDAAFSGGKLTINGGTFTTKGLQADNPGVTLKGGTFSRIQAPSGTTANSLLADGYQYYAGSNTSGAAADGGFQIISQTVTVGERDWSSDITYDSGTKTYTVLSADGLRWISGVTNDTITADTFQSDPQMPEKDFERGYFYGATVKLNTDIDLSGENWTPIQWFGGTFDGAGHNVTGLKIEGVYDQSGFFAALCGEARNLHISGSVNVSSSHDLDAGGIAGTVTEYGQIYNCASGVAVTATPTASGAVYTGGLAGSNGGIIHNCLLKEVTSGALIGRCARFSSTENCYTPVGAEIAGSIESDATFTSVGTYDASGNLTAANSTTLAYGMTLANAVKYWVGRQEEYAGNYVTWTADAIPALTTAYAEDHTSSYGDWVKQADGGYTRTNDYTGLTQTAEASVTDSTDGTITPYATMEEAITAAKDETGSTVKLLTDVTTDAEVDVASGKFTIDLNGKTWSSTVTDSYALSLTENADVTLMDSGTGGKLTSTAAAGYSTVYTSFASAAFKSGTYACTGSDSCALTICDVNEGDQVTITGGTYQGNVAFYSCKNVSISGGTYTAIRVQATSEEDLQTLGGLLADGYAYRSTEDVNKWIISEPTGDLLNVSVQAAPVNITGQPQGAAVAYGYTEAPVLSVTAVPTDSGKTVSYQWYRFGTGAGGMDEPMTDNASGTNYTVQSGLNADTYNYYCTVTCDGYAVKSDNAMVTVNKADGAVANKADGGYATSYTYSGNSIASPAAANFTTNGGTAFTFIWYSGASTDDAAKLSSAPTDAGTYTLKISVAETTNVSAASVTLPVTISKAPPSIGPVTYSGTLYTSTAPSDVTLTRVDTAVAGTLALDGVTALTEGTHDYNWKFTPSDTDNYNTATGTISLTATQDTLESITVTAGTPVKTSYSYGDVFDTNGLTITAAYASSSTKDVTALVTASPLAVGDISATLSFTEGGVTKSCVVPGITVAKAGVIITGMTAPTDRVYNGMAIADSDFGMPTFMPSTYTGDGLTYTYYSGNFATGTPISVPKDAGTYTVRVAIPDDNADYVGHADFTFVIGKATVIAAADNKSMVVGGTLPTFTVSYSGLASGSTADGIFSTPATASCTADGKTAGSYDITAATPVLSEDGAKNYIVGTSVKGTLTISNPSYTGSGGASASTIAVPVSSGEGSVSASASVSGSTASVSMTDNQIKEIASGAGATGTVKVDVSSLKINTVVVPTKVVSAANAVSGTSGLEVALPAGTVTLDKTALDYIAGKGDMKLSVDTVANSTLTDAQKSTLGAQADSATVVDINLYAGGSRVSSFGDGTLQISIPYTLKSGEAADSITVWFIKDDGTIEPKHGTYASGKVTFTTEHLSQYLIVDFPFTDVSEEAWYYNSVAYAYDSALFSGTSATTFSPNTTMTRQMIWMVLARMDGKTPAGMDAARAWAMENSISDGSNPTNRITREQMAAILYRYARYKGCDTTQAGMAIREFADYNSISEYALPALAWMVNAELVQGSDNNIMPSGSATRAQVATILQRFNQNVAK